MFDNMYPRDAPAPPSMPTSPYAMVPLSGPPYPPMFASLGGRPTTNLDVPISVVYMILFIIAGIGHLYHFWDNRRIGYKFILSPLMSSFCMTRTITCILRIAWAYYPTNINLAIAASIFVLAGVLLLFIVNLIFAQRIVRAKQPAFGWSKAFAIFCDIVYVLIVVVLLMVIVMTVYNYFTLDMHIHDIVRNVQQVGSTYFALVAVLPLPLVLFALIKPEQRGHLDEFGTGSWRTKVIVLLAGTTLLAFGACFRCGISFMPLRLFNDPAWYQSKACFYIFDLGVEIVTIWLYLLARVDKRFHVPDGSRALKSYEATDALHRAATNDAEQRQHTVSLSRASTEHESSLEAEKYQV